MHTGRGANGNELTVSSLITLSNFRRTDEVVIGPQDKLEPEADGVVHHPQPGEELLTPAGAVHSASSAGSTTARWLYAYRGSA